MILTSMIGFLRTLLRKVLRRNKRSSVLCSLAKAFLKVKSKVSGANFGCLKLALSAIVLGIILLMEIFHVIKGDFQMRKALLGSNIEKLAKP